MADDTISLQDFISGSYGSQGVPKEQQQGYINQLKQYFPTGQMPKSALSAAYGLLGTAVPGSGTSFVGGTSNPSVSGGDNSQRQMFGAILSALGQGGGGSGQSGPTGPTTNNQFVGNPQYSLNQLGAAALNQPMTVTPFGGGQIDPKSGVSSATPQPVTSSGVPAAPQGPWTNVPGLMGGPALTSAQQATQAAGTTASRLKSDATVPQFQNWYNQNQGKSVLANGVMQTIGGQTGLGPSQLHQYWQSGALGWGSPQGQSSAFAQVAPTRANITPTPQANAASIGAPTPFAQAPAAPGVSVPSAQPQPSGVTGSPAMMAPGAGVNYVPGAFRTPPSGIQQPAGFVSSRETTWAGPGSVHPGAAAALGTKQLATGGPVPGQGNRDSVPAMLTPGEYVVNKQAVQDIGVGNLNRINQGQTPVQHFEYGGQVNQGPELVGWSPEGPAPNQGGDRDQAIELARQTVVAQQRRAAAHTSQARPAQWSYGAPPSGQPPAAPGYRAAPQMTQQERDMAMGRPNFQQPQPLPTNAAGQPDYHYATNWNQFPKHLQPMDLGYGTGYAYQDPFGANAPLSATGGPTGPTTVGQYADTLNAASSPRGGGPPGASSPTAGALGAIGSGLGKVGEQIASSVGSWKPQPSAIPPPPPPNRYQIPGFQENTAV